MWSPLGNNWYDSLQMKATKNYSHGLDFTSSFTWSKELATGQGVNDVFNRANQKSIVDPLGPGDEMFVMHRPARSGFIP